MSSAAIFATSANTVEGDQELTIKICDITTVDAAARQILRLEEQATNVTTIEVSTSTYFQAVEEQEGSAERFQGDVCCSHLETILDAIRRNGGGLKTFSWPASSQDTSRYFTRAHRFWTALYAHGSTLQKLHLDFFCHEVATLPLPPPGSRFETLRDLHLDTSSAHGDDGTVIDTILHASPNLKTLHFEWPPCDLEGCQIKNLSWGWNFPKLTHLNTLGWNLAPTEYTNFLVRHPKLTSLEEHIQSEWDYEEDQPLEARLPTTALLNLQVLKKGYLQTHSLRDYFDTTANRPISTLVLHTSNLYNTKQELLDMTALSAARKNLRTLEFRGDVSDWRPRERDESDGEDEDETPAERALRHEEEERQWHEEEKKNFPNILKAVLPHLTNLETLSIVMDSGNGSWDSKLKDFVDPEPMNRRDLFAVLASLPKKREGSLKVLRMIDDRAVADLRPERIKEWLSENDVDMGDGEATAGSLRVLEWCGNKESVIELR